MGDLYGQTRLAWRKFWQVESLRERDSYMKTGWHDRAERGQRIDYRNGFYERDYVTRLGTIRLRIARTRGQNFLPKGWRNFSAGRGHGDLDSGSLSAGHFDATGRPHRGDPDGRAGECTNRFQAGHGIRSGGRAVPYRRTEGRMGLPVSRWSQSARAAAGGPQLRTHACSLRREAGWHAPSAGLPMQQRRKQQAWEGLLQNLYQRGLLGHRLQLIVTDGCPGLGRCDSSRLSASLASALLGAQDAEHSGEGEKARLHAVKSEAQAIYLSDSRSFARRAFLRFRKRWIQNTRPWCGSSSAICRNSWPFTAFLNHFAGASYHESH